MGYSKVSIPIDQLPVGVTCSHPVIGDDGVLLLGENTRITQQVITGLRERDIDHVQVDPRDAAALGSSERKKSAIKRERSKQSQWQPALPLKELLIDRYSEPFCDTRASELNSQLLMAKNQFEQLQALAESRRLRGISEFLDISDGYARSILDDHDQTVGMIGGARNLDDVSERAIRMSVLGMSVAVEMGLDGPQTLEVGMAGLLHDVGLYSMDPVFAQPIELLTEIERWEYQKHPLLAAEVLGDAVEVPHSVQLAIQQVHEQFDGSGYPRGVKGQRIHVYSRILNVVEAYLQLTSANSQRCAIVQHDAMGLLLHKASRGVFDPTVIRAFLQIETLFPLGSMVELNTGELARVIRRPRTGFASPVLQDSEGNRIELENSTSHIVRPALDRDVEQMRLSQELMQTSLWHPANHSLIEV